MGCKILTIDRREVTRRVHRPLNIPSAEVTPDGRLDPALSNDLDPNLSDDHADPRSFGFSLGVFPYLEIGGRVADSTRMLDLSGNFKLQIPHLPAWVPLWRSRARAKQPVSLPREVAVAPAEDDRAELDWSLRFVECDLRAAGFERVRAALSDDNPRAAA